MRLSRLNVAFSIAIATVTVASFTACSSKNINIAPQNEAPETGPGPGNDGGPNPQQDAGTDTSPPQTGCTFEPHVPKAADGGTLDYAGWPMPDSAGNFNAPSYDDKSLPGVVIDKLTKLEWQKAVGSARAWSEAEAYCSGLSLGGKTGWRLPTRIELLSIVYWGSPLPDAGLPSPSLSPLFDPPAGQGYFWTSTPVAGTSDQRWSVVFTGVVPGPVQAPTDATTKFEVRCVHGTTAAPKLSLSKDCNIVRDENTGLEWQRAFTSVPYANNAPRNQCAALQLGAPGDNGGWRLPTMQELYTIVDTSRTDPAVDTTLFPGAQSSRFISDTLIGSPGMDPIAAALNLQDGSQDAVSPTDTLPVRCMRPMKK
jgi:hypothetical protein